MACAGSSGRARSTRRTRRWRPWRPRSAPRCADPRKLDRRALVHDDAQPGLAGALRRRLVDHAELQPYRLRADLDRLVHVRAGGGGAPEQVDDLHALVGGDVLQRWVAALPEDLVALRVDGD